ncbi:MAG: hypothetical protein AB1649_01515 [Chloroflexota bacterium]
MSKQIESEFEKYLQWEKATRDVLDVKRVYIDMAGDLVAGIVLSEILYWYQPNKNGESKLRVVKDGDYWIAIPRWEWWDRIRITPKQADRALSILKNDKQLIEAKRFRFNGEVAVHVKLKKAEFLAALEVATKRPPENPWLTKHEKEKRDAQNKPSTGKRILPFSRNPI